MSQFDSAEVARVAALARIELTEEEIDRLADELQVISLAVEKVSAIVTPDIPPTSHPIPLTNVMREDVVTPTLDRDEVLAAAPEAQDGQFVVPQILGEDA